MIFTETALPEAYVIDPERVEDDRGFFARTWSASEFTDRGLDAIIVQCSLSWNPRRGTLRGMHFQRPPHEEVKLVRCTRGRVFDVIIDLRPEARTFRRWVGVELDQESRSMLYVPKGFAHGFQTLEDETEVQYMMSEAYAPGFDDGVRWDDPAFGVRWPLPPTAMSDRDRSWPDLRQRDDERARARGGIS